MIELYHGSNVDISDIDLTLSRAGKDFGKGFYLNPNREQALLMAKRTANRMMSGEPIVNTYLFDENLLQQEDATLSIKVFEEYTIEWANFVLQNRRNLTALPIHSYDIMIGPIANDTVGLQMHRYLQGYISLERMIEELRFNKPSIQYFFGTELAISKLKKI